MRKRYFLTFGIAGGAACRRRLMRFALLTSAATALIGGSAFAQETGRPSTVGVEEIVVTARKLGEEISKAPVAATMINADTLVRQQIKTLGDLATPSMIYAESYTYANVFIRGIGTNVALAGLESSVATYIDGTYLEQELGAAADAVDVSNVTILNGPQGTLYGRNATGGAIVVETANPTNQLEGHVTGEYGNFNAKFLEGVLNVPVSDTFAIRVAGRVKDRDGWAPNLNDPLHPDGFRREDTIRLKARWTPTDNFSAVYKVEYWFLNTSSQPSRNTVAAPYCLACALYPTSPSGVGASFYASTMTPGNYAHERNLSHTLTLNYQGEGYTVNSVTDYRYQNGDSRNDPDGIGAPFFDSGFTNKSPTIYHETFVRTAFDSKLNGLAGATYMWNHNKQEFHFGGDLFGGPYTTDFSGPAYAHDFNYVTVKAYSIYGELNYAFADGFKITAGARFSHDSKTVHVVNSVLSGSANFTKHASFNSTTPRAVLSYESGDGYYYASYNRGVKSGGFSSPLAAASVIATRPETLDSFEIGAKNTWLDGRLHTTLDGYYGIYKDIQVQVIETGPPPTQLLENAAAGRLEGVEFNGNFAVTPEFTLGAGVSWSHNYFRSFPDAAVYGRPTDPGCQPAPLGIATCVVDLSGARMQYSPKWSGFVSADYTADLNGGWTARTNWTMHFTSGYDIFAGGGGYFQNDVQKGYATVDGSVTLTLPDGKTEIGGYVRNLFEKHYLAGSITEALVAYVNPAMPRTYGVRVSRSF